MKLKTIAFFIALLFSGSSYLRAQVFKNSDLKITPLYDHCWVVETSDMTTMYIVEGKDKALLIDTGTHCDSLDQVVRRITQKPLYVVITHAHGDHDGNIRFFRDIYMHPADTVLMDGSYKGKIHFVKEGDVFDLGGKKIEVLFTPAHTPGSIVLLDRQAKSCFSGDAFGSGQVWLQLRPNLPMQTYVNSCNKMIAVMDNGIDSIYCGHYPYTKSALDKEYIISMKNIASALINGNESNIEPYPVKVSIGCDNPMIATEGKAAIVFDPEHIK
ncbi:MAG: MBL fold metallo-hydrolase [Bacteroidales bacterium]|nr:MBL fold metallo-hydrolase [Bacteroidales bacterium]MCB8999536.1 MBL fold metallo-hydrolase [Bacteroidales bacterium]MCB9012957.1 MBL fold metallo-hydrolase [Bacteroidales bacterium]